VLGVYYDTVAWKWRIPSEKLDRTLHLIYDILGAVHVKGHLLESLVGKIIHIKALIPECKFHISELMKAVREVRAGVKLIVISPKMREQLDYWRIILPLCNGNMAIPDKTDLFPQWAIEFHTDAAGGSEVSKWRGLGMVYDGGWCYLPWTRNISFGKRDHNGKSLAKKMSFLELLGALLVVCAAPDVCRGNNVQVWIDNIGAVKIWQKGYSPNCELCTAVVRATAFVASHLQCRLDIVKIGRCSDGPSIMADALSKGDMQKFLSLWKGPLPDGRFIPAQLVQWISDPQPLAPLGPLLCSEIDSYYTRTE
jgi:hypothetical protein